MSKETIKKQVDAVEEKVLSYGDHKIQTGIQQDGKVIHPSTGEVIKQDVSKTKNIWSPK